MPKCITLHDAETGQEIKVNAFNLKIESIVIASDWVECAAGVPKELSSNLNTNNIKGTPIRWVDENGKEHTRKVIESPNVIKERKNNIQDIKP